MPDAPVDTANSDINSRFDALFRRLGWRLMPLLVAVFVIALVDRQNVGFAKLQMLADLQISEAAYGLGASLFFAGYLIFQIPSSVFLARIGAKRWLALTVIAWGTVTVLLACTATVAGFYFLRFLLGAAQAGFYPGVIYFIGVWFPRAYRVRMLSLFAIGSPVGNMLGGLISSPLLGIDGTWGLAGWQWVFIGSGLPAIVLSLLVFLYLPSSPRSPGLLSKDEIKLFAAAHAADPDPQARTDRPTRLIFDRRLALLAAVYLLMNTAFYGVTYWLPTVIAGFGASTTANSFLNAIPWAAGAVFLMVLPWLLPNDSSVFKIGAAIALSGALSFAASIVLVGYKQRFAALVLGAACLTAMYPCFWSLPSRYIEAARAAVFIAAINSFGNLGGFFAPNLMPWFAQLTEDRSFSMIVPAACLTAVGICAILAVVHGHSKNRVASSSR